MNFVCVASVRGMARWSRATAGFMMFTLAADLVAPARAEGTGGGTLE